MLVAHNGPAIWGGCVTRRQYRVESMIFSREFITVQGGYGALFAVIVQILPEHYACRGTTLVGAGKISRYRMFVRGTGAVSRYKLSRRQKSVTVQDLYCGQVRVSGFKMLNEFIWPAEQGMMIKDQKKKEGSGP